jgi:hypothetical protein
MLGDTLTAAGSPGHLDAPTVTTIGPRPLRGRDEVLAAVDAVSYGQYRYERSKQTDSWDRKDVIAASTLKGRVLEQQVPSADWVILRLHTKIRDETTTVLAELPSDLVRRAAAADAPVLARADLATLARRLLGKQLDIRMGPSRQPFASDRHRRTRVLRINPDASVTVS